MKYANAGGIRIAYHDEGARADDAVVLLPGWCNSGRSSFALLAERLAARHRVIRPDWRGHGDSGRPGADLPRRAGHAMSRPAGPEAMIYHWRHAPDRRL
jgi:pimeloyl-ACP methyl ester carboxylesterase